MIHRQEIYVRDDGVIIQVRIQQVETPDGLVDGATTFHATGMMQFTANGRTGVEQFPVEIPAASVTEAFANFPAAFEAAKKKAATSVQARLQAEQRKILVPVR